MYLGHVMRGGQMMFLDCPAYLDEDGARRCGLPAEVRRRFTMRSSDGPLEAAMIRCPSGHWFNGPIGSLTWESDEKLHPGEAGAASSATHRSREDLTTAARTGQRPIPPQLLPTIWGGLPACG